MKKLLLVLLASLMVLTLAACGSKEEPTHHRRFHKQGANRVRCDIPCTPCNLRSACGHDTCHQAAHRLPVFPRRQKAYPHPISCFHSSQPP